MDPLLHGKDVERIFQIDRTTLFRWRKLGLPCVAGKWYREQEVLFWLEQKEAAKSLGMDVKAFLKQPREVREKLLEAALLAREALAGAV